MRPGAQVTVALWTLLALLLAVQIGRFVLHQEMNADEGFYALAARSALGGLLPYRDFGYSQMPVLPYLNGLAMRAISFGLLEQRAVNAAWGVLTLLLLAWGGRRILPRHFPLVVLAVLALLVLSPGWLGAVCLGKPYAAAGLFLAASGLAVLMPGPLSHRALLAAACGALAVGCRLTVAPTVGLLALVLLREAGSWRKRALIAGLFAAAGLLVVTPFFAAAPEPFLFWNAGFHAGTTVDRRGWTSLLEALAFAPGVAATTGLALTLPFKRERAVLSTPAFGVLAATAAGAACQLILPSAYGAALAPFAPLAALTSLAVLALVRTPVCGHSALAGLAVAALTFFFTQPVLDQRLPGSLRETASFVATHTAPGARILTPLPILAVDSGREVVPGLEMGMFGLTAEFAADEAARVHLMTPARLIALTEAGEPSAVVLVDGPSVWNFAWSVPSLMPMPEAFTVRMNQALLKHYRRAYANGAFVVYLPAVPIEAPPTGPPAP